MDKITIHQDKKNGDANAAFQMACVFFEECHPRESWPDWLEKLIGFSATKNKKNNWVVQLTLMHIPQLKPNQYWEWSTESEKPHIIDVDTITGEKLIVVSGGPPTDIDILFEVELDFENREYEIIVDTDLNTLDRTKYEISKE